MAYIYRVYIGFIYIYRGIYMRVIFKVFSHPKIKLHQHMPGVAQYVQVFSELRTLHIPSYIIIQLI